MGGAAYLVSKAIRGSRMVAFEDLGMEAIRDVLIRDCVALEQRGHARAVSPA